MSIVIGVSDIQIFYCTIRLVLVKCLIQYNLCSKQAANKYVIEVSVIS